MQKITSDQFKAAIELDPAWASKLTEPVEITEYCDMQQTRITHLSPLLHFTGIDNAGWCASFSECKSLKVAEGKFEGFVDFSHASIEKIGDLSCGKNKYGNSACFKDCESLKIAQGKFEGYVDFSDSGIEKIGDLTCGKNNRGIRLNVQDCPNLIKIPITFNPKEVEASEELLKRLREDWLRDTSKKHLQTKTIEI